MMRYHLHDYIQLHDRKNSVEVILQLADSELFKRNSTFGGPDLIKEKRKKRFKAKDISSVGFEKASCLVVEWLICQGKVLAPEVEKGL